MELLRSVATKCLIMGSLRFLHPGRSLRWLIEGWICNYDFHCWCYTTRVFFEKVRKRDKCRKCSKGEHAPPLTPLGLVGSRRWWSREWHFGNAGRPISNAGALALRSMLGSQGLSIQSIEFYTSLSYKCNENELNWRVCHCHFPNFSRLFHQEAANGAQGAEFRPPPGIFWRNS